MGYLYVKQLRNGNELGRFVHTFIAFAQRTFAKKTKLKVTKNPNRSTSKSTGSRSSSSRSVASQEEIDKILDKISVSGYESLSKDEKEKLFSASNKGPK